MVISDKTLDYSMQEVHITVELCQVGRDQYNILTREGRIPIPGWSGIKLPRVQVDEIIEVVQAIYTPLEVFVVEIIPN